MHTLTTRESLIICTTTMWSLGFVRPTLELMLTASCSRVSPAQQMPKWRQCHSTLSKISHGLSRQKCSNLENIPDVCHIVYDIPEQNTFWRVMHADILCQEDREQHRGQRMHQT